MLLVLSSIINSLSYLQKDKVDIVRINLFSSVLSFLGFLLMNDEYGINTSSLEFVKYGCYLLGAGTLEVFLLGVLRCVVDISNGLLMISIPYLYCMYSLVYKDVKHMRISYLIYEASIVVYSVVICDWKFAIIKFICVLIVMISCFRYTK